MNRIFELSGIKCTPEISADLWPKILNHKWLLSEKIGRDVGDRVACIDYLENTLKDPSQYEAAKREASSDKTGSTFHEQGAMGYDIRFPAAETACPEEDDILPLIEERLSRKHGVRQPKSIIFFGPPGTGKTHSARAIAGILSWWYIEIVPSMLMIDGLEKVGANLRQIMERT